MKRILFPLLLVLFTCSAHAQVQGVIVEKYYVSDSLDATDSTNWYADTTYATHILPKGSITYRVYVKLSPGCRIKKIYGPPCNPLRFTSTSDFFNNIDRPLAA